jgi:hypothetical protein
MKGGNMTESEKNNKATKIAQDCVNASHYKEWNPWTLRDEPELCEKCDALSGEMFD